MARGTQIQIRLSHAEKDEIERAAKEAGLDVSEFVRSRTLRRRTPHHDFPLGEKPKDEPGPVARIFG